MTIGNANSRNGSLTLTASRFRSLGILTGKSRQEIISKVGSPTSVSTLAHGQLLQWQEPGFHIALKFDERGMFQGVTHEYTSRR
jgi:hypothetical protein